MGGVAHVQAARTVIGIAITAAVLLTATGCDNGNRNATVASSARADSISISDAERRAREVILESEDIGPEYALDAERVQTNEQSARARPDTAAAIRQYEAWGQVLALNAQFSAPTLRGVAYSPQFARVMHTATIFHDADGASTALLYVRGLSPALLSDILTNEGAGTQISDTQVTKDIAFPAQGDESFAWRVSGKATFQSRENITFIADTVFVRAGNVNAAITAVSLGDAPDRTELERLVHRFVEKARAE